MVLPSRLRPVDHRVRTGRFRTALRELTAVYDAAEPIDRLLMAGIRFHLGEWREAEALAQGLAGGRGIPLDIQGRAFELLTWLVKHKHGVPRALGFAEKALHLALKANDLEQICRAQFAMLVARADAHGPDGLGTLIADTHGNVMRLGDARVLAWLHIRLAEVEARRGRFDQTERHLDLVATDDVALEDEDLLAAVQVSLLRGVAATLALHPERSLMHNREALRCAREAGYHFGEVAALLNIGQLSLNARRLDEARHYLDLAEPLLGDRLPLTIGWTDTRAQLALAEGNLRECQRLVNRLAVLSDINRSPKPSYSSLEATLTRVRLQRRQGDMQGALTLLEEGAREARARQSPVLEATFDVQRADVLLETGRPAEALRALRDASRHSLGSFITVLAEAERVRARAADALGLDALARARAARAARIFAAIGQPVTDTALDTPPLDPRESGLLMLESAASLLELGGRRDLLAEEVFDLLKRNLRSGALALVRRQPAGHARDASGPSAASTGVTHDGTPKPPIELRRSHNWTRPLDTRTGDARHALARVIVPSPEEEASYELLVDDADNAAIGPLVDAVQALVDASARLDAVRTLRLKTSAYAHTDAAASFGRDESRAFGARSSSASRSSATSALSPEAAPSSTASAAPGHDDLGERASSSSGSRRARGSSDAVSQAGARASRAIFASATMLDLLRQAERVGRTDLTVLITGETGVGKEILAEEIRRVSSRDWSRFAKVVCSAASRELLETQLFAPADETEADEAAVDVADSADNESAETGPTESGEMEVGEMEVGETQGDTKGAPSTAAAVAADGNALRDDSAAPDRAAADFTAHDSTQRDSTDLGSSGGHLADHRSSGSASARSASGDATANQSTSSDAPSSHAAWSDAPASDASARDAAWNGAPLSLDRGTLLLDEIGELPLDAQLVLLQLIDARDSHATGASVLPVHIPPGASGTRLVRRTPRDVRLICVTNANLDQLVLERRFRDDLLHRINIVTLRVPPLRERRDEILPLARHFLELLSARHQRPAPRLSDEAAEQLLLYGWPGNVRELRNEMERIVSLLDPDVTLVRVEALSDNVRLARPDGGLAWSAAGDTPGPTAAPDAGAEGGVRFEQIAVRADLPLREALEELEREIIARRIRQSPGNLDRIAAGLGLSRKGLYMKRQRYGLL